MKNNWTEEEIQILIENYKKIKVKELQVLLPNRSIGAIQAKAYLLNLASKNIKWTDEEIELLINGDLLKIKRNRLSINDKRRELNLTKKIKPKRIAKLLDNNIINANIWGFIFGDGHLSKTGTLQIQIKKDDHEYLQYVANYLNGEVKFGETKYTHKQTEEFKQYCYLQIGDNENVLKLKEKLQISNQKTYNPPQNLDFIQTKEELIAFLIGLIDSDGHISIRNNKFECIKLGMHSNWENWIRLLSTEIYKVFGIECKIYKETKRNIILLKIFTKKNYQLLKDFIVENNINYMKRKWTM